MMLNVIVVYLVLWVFVADLGEILIVFYFFFFSSRRRHTRCREVSWARRCVQETVVEVLDKLFADVCELDILYNPEKINFILDELIVDGNVVQTSLKEAVENLNLMAKSEAAS
eukprot:TRINITY_DN12081_c0_g1_i3.p3 TRINITY_DN12081_c0_g1~~TRINITY_DN12081_c0_g1_i3.p3  ORF type:complete len:113 (-),score=43.77 TRINITY_DN12081_c0_g1_i3:43-381(-)